MNPNAGTGISSLKLGFSFVALMLLRLYVFITPVTGGTTGATGGIGKTAGFGTSAFLALFEATAFLARITDVDIFFPLGATIFFVFVAFLGVILAI